MAEYKLLDPNRKAILKLPSGAVHLWFTFFMYENDDQRAYPAMEELMEATGMSKPTIIKHREYLLATGWLVRCKGSAADYYSKATPGSHQVWVYRVDDPTKGKETLPLSTATRQGSRKLTRKEVLPKVSISGSGLPGSFYEDTNPRPDSIVNVSDESGVASLFPPSAEEKNRVNQKPKAPSVPCEAPAATPLPPQADTERSQAPSQPRLKKSPHKYGAPFPPDFDADKSPAGVMFRNEWMAKHKLPPEKLKELESSAEPTRPQDASAPSALWLAQELFRTIKQIPGIVLSVVACRWETKWVADFERLLKTYTMEELTDMIKVSQTIYPLPAFNSQEFVDNVPDLHKTVQERKTQKTAHAWQRIEGSYREKYGERRE